eukprot:jgi/Mesvir1/5125/Mv15280-RA.2
MQWHLIYAQNWPMDSPSILPRNRSSSSLNRLSGTRRPSLLVITIVFLMVSFSSLVGWMIVLASSTTVNSLNYIDGGVHTRSGQEHVGLAQASMQPGASHNREETQAGKLEPQAVLFPTIEILRPSMGQEFEQGGDVLLLPRVHLGPWDMHHLTLCVHVAPVAHGAPVGGQSSTADGAQERSMYNGAGNGDGRGQGGGATDAVNGGGRGTPSGQGAQGDSLLEEQEGTTTALAQEREKQEGSGTGSRLQQAVPVVDPQAPVVDQCMELGRLKETAMHLRGLALGQYQAKLALQRSQDSPAAATVAGPAAAGTVADDSTTKGAGASDGSQGKPVMHASLPGAISSSRGGDNSLLASTTVRFAIVSQRPQQPQGLLGLGGPLGNQEGDAPGHPPGGGAEDGRHPMSLHPTRRGDTEPGSATGAGPAPFVPSYAWQAVPEGVNVPAGLEVRLPLDGSGTKEARIPDPWQLTFYPSRTWALSEVSYFFFDA